MSAIIPLIFVGISLVALTGCESQADRDKLANDKLLYGTTLQEETYDLANQRHVFQVDSVRMLQGEAAADQMKVCFYDDGYDYPRRANLDGSGRPIHLSGRAISQCDQIMEVQVRHVKKFAGKEKRKDNDYDRQHPK